MEHLIVHDPLDLVEYPLALLPVQFPRLALEQLIDLENGARGKQPPLDGKGLDAGGGIACRSADRHEDSLELLLSPGSQKGSALHRANSRANAHCLELALDGFAHREVRRVRNEVAGVEPIGIAGVSEQLARTLSIEWRRLEGQSELETAGHDASGQTRESKGLGVVEGLPVHGEARGQAHPAVVPRRFRV